MSLLDKLKGFLSGTSEAREQPPAGDQGAPPIVPIDPLGTTPGPIPGTMPPAPPQAQTERDEP
ncbi:MAG: hypothetical protein H0V79_10365 [Actinobacteria bacterium]|nr:hypothetical protein [Actinomycetota bacterium]